MSNDTQPSLFVSTLSKSDVEEKSKPPLLVRQTWVRWVFLAVATVYVFGNYFCYDSVSPITLTLENPPYGFSPLQVSALYSVYSVPNLVLPLLGGIMIDKLGLK